MGMSAGSAVPAGRRGDGTGYGVTDGAARESLADVSRKRRKGRAIAGHGRWAGKLPSHPARTRKEEAGRQAGGAGAESSVAEIAGAVLRISVLLGAGAVPQDAWRHLAETGDAAAGRIAERASGGVPVAEAIGAEASLGRPGFGRRRRAAGDRAAAWSDVSAAWEIASTVGAPLADALRGMADALRDAQETLDDVRVAMAEPTHTARLMSVLPLLGVVIALGLGFDVLGVLFSPGAGLACLVAGLAMILGGRLWASGLIRAARPEPGTPGLRAELTAIALGGGVSLDRARSLVAATDGGGSTAGVVRGGRARHRRQRRGARLLSRRDRTAGAADGALHEGAAAPDAEVDRVLELSRRAGIPAVDLLRATAEQQRLHARTDGRVRAARLGTRLLLPLGACTLPAFLCLGVVPMLLAGLGATTLPGLP